MTLQLRQIFFTEAETLMVLSKKLINALSIQTKLKTGPLNTWIKKLDQTNLCHQDLKLAFFKRESYC